LKGREGKEEENEKCHRVRLIVISAIPMNRGVGEKGCAENSQGDRGDGEGVGLETNPVCSYRGVERWGGGMSVCSRWLGRIRDKNCLRPLGHEKRGGWKSDPYHGGGVLGKRLRRIDLGPGEIGLQYKKDTSLSGSF